MTSDKLIKHLSLFCNHSICQVAFILSSHLYYNLLRDLLFICLFHNLYMIKYSRQTGYEMLKVYCIQMCYKYLNAKS